MSHNLSKDDKKFIQQLRNRKRELPIILNNLKDQRDYLEFALVAVVTPLHDIAQNLTIFDCEETLKIALPKIHDELLPKMSDEQLSRSPETIERIRHLYKGFNDPKVYAVIHPLTEIVDNLQRAIHGDEPLNLLLTQILNDTNNHLITLFEQRIKNYNHANL